MNDRVKSLPPDEQRQIIAEAVVELAVEQNFSGISTTAIFMTNMSHDTP